MNRRDSLRTISDFETKQFDQWTFEGIRLDFRLDY